MRDKVLTNFDRVYHEDHLELRTVTNAIDVRLRSAYPSEVDWRTVARLAGQLQRKAKQLEKNNTLFESEE